MCRNRIHANDQRLKAQSSLASKLHTHLHWPGGVAPRGRVLPTITLGWLGQSGQTFPELALIGGLGGTDPVLHALICDSRQHSTPVSVHSLRCTCIMLDFFPYFFGGGAPCKICRILIPQPETEPGPLAVKVQNPNHWTTWEFPMVDFNCSSSVVKNPPANAGDMGSTPGSGRSPGEGKDKLLQYSCLGNLIDSGAWRATVHGVAKSWTQHSD